MMLTSLREIRGVGEKVRAELIAAYGSEAEALHSLSELRFHGLFSSSIPRQKQAEIAREVFSKVTGVKYTPLFATPEARQLYTQVLDVLCREAKTQYARGRFSLFYPVAEERSLMVLRRDVKLGVELARSLGSRLKEVHSLLGGVSPPRRGKKVRISSQVLAVEDEELYTELSSKYGDVIEVLLVESAEDLETLRSYELVRYVEGERGYAGMSLMSNVEVFPSFSEPGMLPEIVLGFFEANLESIEICARVFRMLGRELLRKLGRQYLDGQVLSHIVEEMRGYMETANPYSYASANFALVSEAMVEQANRELEQRVEKCGLALRGTEMLEFLSRLGSSQHYLPPDLRELISEVAEEYEARLAGELRLDEEVLRFSGLFSTGYPIELNPERRAELEEWLSAEAARRSFLEARELAMRLVDRIEGVRCSIELALELDYLLALGGFVLRRSATLPEVGKELKLRFSEARHVMLNPSKVQPVSYELGFDGTRIAIITGANSGGKTTLLETIAQVQIMAQCGLPVLAAHAEVPLLERLYFFAKRRGGEGAGAFESLLRSFANIAGHRERRLILADEIEAVTEPGAAARVIAAMLEWFSGEGETLAAIVTHLGAELKDMNIPAMRIDGIQARGLDEDLNLIVDRNPVLGRLARSTPELILERLSRMEGGEFYSFLLKRFREGQ